MRRPVFKRWIRRLCLDLAGVDSFRLRELAALAQNPPKSSAKSKTPDLSLKAALDLHAIADGCESRLRNCYWDDAAIEELDSISAIVGGRNLEQLALRGSPMRSIPAPHRAVLAAFEQDYRRPEQIEQQKLALREESLLLLKKSGVLYASISEATGIAVPNLSGYFKNASAGKVTLEGAQAIHKYLQSVIEEGN